MKIERKINSAKLALQGSGNSTSELDTSRMRSIICDICDSYGGVEKISKVLGQSPECRFIEVSVDGTFDDEIVVTQTFIIGLGETYFIVSTLDNGETISYQGNTLEEFDKDFENCLTTYNRSKNRNNS